MRVFSVDEFLVKKCTVNIALIYVYFFAWNIKDFALFFFFLGVLILDISLYLFFSSSSSFIPFTLYISLPSLSISLSLRLQRHSLMTRVEEARSSALSAKSQGRLMTALTAEKQKGNIPGILGRLVGGVLSRGVKHSEFVTI